MARLARSTTVTSTHSCGNSLLQALRERVAIAKQTARERERQRRAPALLDDRTNQLQQVFRGFVHDPQRVLVAARGLFENGASVAGNLDDRRRQTDRDARAVLDRRRRPARAVRPHRSRTPNRDRRADSRTRPRTVRCRRPPRRRSSRYRRSARCRPLRGARRATRCVRRGSPQAVRRETALATTGRVALEPRSSLRRQRRRRSRRQIRLRERSRSRARAPARRRRGRRRSDLRAWLRPCARVRARARTPRRCGCRPRQRRRRGWASQRPIGDPGASCIGASLCARAGWFPVTFAVAAGVVRSVLRRVGAGGAVGRQSNAPASDPAPTASRSSFPRRARTGSTRTSR